MPQVSKGLRKPCSSSTNPIESLDLCIAQSGPEIARNEKVQDGDRNSIRQLKLREVTQHFGKAARFEALALRAANFHNSVHASTVAKKSFDDSEGFVEKTSSA